MSDDADFESSPEASPVKDLPFKKKYEVQVTDSVKDGETLTFTLIVKKLEGDSNDRVITRQFEDFVWLHHCVTTQNDINGVIVPPLPSRPDIDPKTVENKSKNKLGSSSNVLIGDDFHKDCRKAEKYLNLLLSHEVFGRDKGLEKFLCETEAPQRIRVKKGILTKISSAVDEARKGHHRDIDDYFHKKREWATDYSKLIRETSENFDNVVAAQLRIAAVHTHLSTAVSGTNSSKDENSKKLTRILGKLCDALEHSKHGLEVLSANDEKTLGFQLDLYSRYVESIKEMLLKRTSLLIDYEDANKALDKAKPIKKQAAEETKIAAEKEYEACTDKARIEVYTKVIPIQGMRVQRVKAHHSRSRKLFKSFLQQRLLDFESGMTLFAESQIKTARDTYTLLVRTLSEVKQMD